MKNLLSALLCAGGLILLFLGARDLLDWHIGQSEAQQEFESTPSPATPIPATPTTSTENKANIAATTPATTTPAAATTRPPLQVELGDTLAKMIIPRLDAQLYVVEGDGPKQLRRGPGHLTGTALPGGDGNCVIAGHRDTHFRVLKDIRKGDDILMQTKTGEYLYRVQSIRVISPDYTQPLQPTEEPQLNLITCYPFYYVGSAPKRFVVEARLAGIVSRTS